MSELEHSIAQIVETRMDELMARMSQMMDQKLDNVYTELRQLESHLDQLDHKDLSESVPELCDDFPDDRCPLPRYISVKQYLLNKPANDDRWLGYDISDHLDSVLEKHTGDLTPALFTRIITYHTCASEIMQNLLIRVPEIDDDPRVGPIIKQYSLRVQKDHKAWLTEIADALGVREIPLKPYTMYERDEDFNISFKLLMKYDRDRYHVYDYLENLLDALQDSPIRAIRKGACLNFMLPPPFIKWWSPTYPSDKIDTMMACIKGRVSEEVAQALVDDVIYHIALFMDTRKTNPKIQDRLFGLESWAPNRKLTSYLNLIWQDIDYSDDINLLCQEYM